MYILPNTINFCCGTKHRVLLFSFYHLYILAFLNRNAYRILILHDRRFRARLCLMRSNDLLDSQGERKNYFMRVVLGNLFHLEHISLVLGAP